MMAGNRGTRRLAAPEGKTTCLRAERFPRRKLSLMSINRLIPNVALRSCRQTMLAELLLAMLAIPACGIGQPSGTAESVEWSYDGPGSSREMGLAF